jgi:hypothetical protein
MATLHWVTGTVDAGTLMSPRRTQKVFVALVILGLLITTSSGRAIAAPIQDSGVASRTSSISLADEEASDEDENSEDGWFDRVVDTGGDIVGGAKDVIVDTVDGAWNVVKATPGTVWDVIQGAPGAIIVAVTGAWNWLTDSSIELETWREFLGRHPRLGLILGPIVSLLIGLSPDGTISYLEIGLGLIVLAVPVIKGAPIVGGWIDNLLPWANDVDNVAVAVRRNPGGFMSGVRDTLSFTRARGIAPTADNFATLPGSPGVYVAVDASGTPLYVGRSNSLLNRVPDHFDNTPGAFAGSTNQIKILPTKTVAESKALECRLIKALMPEHNTVYKNANACPVFLPAVTLPIP